MKFQQIRGATAIVTYGGRKFLIDPFLADKGSVPAVPSPYNQYPNPLVELPLPKEEIVKVDAVIVTHMHHFDHFDEAAREAIDRDIPVFTQNETEAHDMRALGFTEVHALQERGINFDGISLYRTEAEHGRGKEAMKNYASFGLPSEASGVVFKHPAEKVLYMAGDTLWNDKVKDIILMHQPKVIALNAAHAQFADGTPILMGTDGLYQVAKVAPEATIIATHLDAVNHARVGRKEMLQFVQDNGLMEQVLIPNDGEEIRL